MPEFVSVQSFAVNKTSRLQHLCTAPCKPRPCIGSFYPFQTIFPIQKIDRIFYRRSMHKEKKMIFFRNKKEKLYIERLYYTYRKFMFVVAFEILEDGTLAEEAIQNSFENIIKSGIIIDDMDEKKVKSLLKVICRNVAIDILRKMGKEVPMYDNIPDRRYDDVADVIINKENLTRLLDCINSLRPIYRDVMMLKFYHGYENREVAKMLSITEDAVRKRIERGRKELRILLDKEAEKDEV